MAKHFHNENFWHDFHERFDDDSEDIKDRIDNIKEMVNHFYDYDNN